MIDDKEQELLQQLMQHYKNRQQDAYEYGVLTAFAQLFVDREIDEQQFTRIVTTYVLSTQHNWKLEFEKERNHYEALKALRFLTNQLIQQDIALDFFEMEYNQIRDI